MRYMKKKPRVVANLDTVMCYKLSIHSLGDLLLEHCDSLCYSINTVNKYPTIWPTDKTPCGCSDHNGPSMMKMWGGRVWRREPGVGGWGLGEWVHRKAREKHFGCTCTL